MEKHIKITVWVIQIIRSNLDLIHPQTYYITKSGVLQSLRKPQDGTIRIGRESIIDTNFVYNDIMLNTRNTLISRSHCLINYQEFFRHAFPNVYLSFLMGSHSRLGQKSVLLTLPQTLFKYILDFITEPKLPIIISPSSITYLRIQSSTPVSLKLGMGILVGFALYFTVEVLEEFLCVLKSDNSGKCFYFTYEENKEYCLGNENMDMTDISGEIIEKVQFRVKCRKQKWLIADGQEGKPSRTGTWMRIGDTHEYLANKAEVKIGEFILKIDW